MNSLRKRVRVLLPGDPGFTEGSRPFNARYHDVVPAAVVAVRSADDVVAAIEWARSHDMPLVARGGGHSYAGTSVNTGLVLDLRGLDRVVVDPATGLVTMGGGTRMRALYNALQPHDLAFPLGNADEVGIGGLTLGGGVSAVSRAFGLTCDSLARTEVVLADGRVVTCDDTSHPDLFWACRGGGGFGVHTSFTFLARPVRASSTCLLLWEWADAVDVVLRMQEIQLAAPDAFSARIGLGGTPPVVSVVGWHLGPVEELRSLLASVLGRAVRVDIADRTYWQAKDFVQHETAGGAFAGRTRTTSVPVSEAGVRTMVAAVGKWPGSGNPDGGGAALFGWGGAINRVPATATAFPHRDTQFLVSLDTSWAVDDSPQTVRDNLDWLTALYKDMGEYAGDGSYANFTDPDLTDWRSAYYGPNQSRLAAVQHHYDPHRVFSQSM